MGMDRHQNHVPKWSHTRVIGGGRFVTPLAVRVTKTAPLSEGYRQHCCNLFVRLVSVSDIRMQCNSSNVATRPTNDSQHAQNV